MICWGGVGGSSESKEQRVDSSKDKGALGTRLFVYRILIMHINPFFPYCCFLQKLPSMFFFCSTEEQMFIVIIILEAYWGLEKVDTPKTTKFPACQKVSDEANMILNRFVKKKFPNAPDWCVGGILLVLLLWLMVLPVEILQALMGQDLIRPSLFGWFIRSFYFFGFEMSVSLISHWASPSLINNELRWVVVLLGLIISSPGYFLIGSLLTTRKGVAVFWGILLLAISIILGCSTTLLLVLSSD